MSDTAAVLQVKDLEVSALTDRGRVTIAAGVNLEIERGQTLALVGESGSGKTVTALAIMGLLPEPSLRREHGRIELHGEALTSMSERELSMLRGDRLSMIFQEPMTSLDPAFTVGQLIGEVLRRHRGLSRSAARAKGIELLERVGIPAASHRINDYPYAFSGGMRQRVMIAMAIACEPEVLIADEPTTALDVTVQAQILELLRSLQDEFDMAVLLVTHDLAVVAESSESVAVMYAGQIVEVASSDDLFTRPLHPYTAGLVRSIPRSDVRQRRLDAIGGRIPAPHEVAVGCHFAPRCDYATERCSTPVEIVVAEPGRRVRCCNWESLDLSESMK